MRHRLLWISIVFSITACDDPAERPADTVASMPVGEAATEPVTTDSAPIAPAPRRSTPEVSDSQWVVTEHGIGPLRAGMTLAQARSVLPGLKIPAGVDGGACTYASAQGLPRGVRVMVEQETLVRVEVDRANVPTSKGARVGDSEERTKSLYPNQVTVSPHKYTDGHYLTVVPAAKADSAYRIIFETDGKRVLKYRAGIRPQVEYVEGCS